MQKNKNKEILRNLPSVNEIITNKRIKNLSENFPHWILVQKARETVDYIRDRIVRNEDVSDRSLIIFLKMMEEKLKKISKLNLRKAVNCTGVIIHTNLGRAPLSKNAIDSIKNVCESFSNLEYNLETGKRGSRNDHLSEMIRLLTGAEDSLVVNNNAAALMLCLSTFAKRKEVIVSRGEIVEIGGGFRINEIINAGNSVLKEVGTTNRTRIDDYSSAIGNKTKIILKVHTSNFKIVGYRQEVNLNELVEVALRNGILTLFDAGSGLLTEINKPSLEGEFSIKEVIKTGVDLITFSGDKLLGGPQCGIISGKKDLIARIKKNPMSRALRVCKMTLAALQATLLHYLRGEYEKIPVLEMMGKQVPEIKRNAEKLAKMLRREDSWHFSDIIVREGKSFIGGGSYPGINLKTILVAINSKGNSSKIEKAFRSFEPPIVVRIENDEVLLDLRTILKQEFKFIVKAFKNVLREIKKK